MKRKQNLLYSSLTFIVLLLASIVFSTTSRAQDASSYFRPAGGDTLIIMSATSINIGVGYEKGLSSSYRLIGAQYLVELGLTYNPFFHDKFAGVTVNLGIMPLSTRMQSGLFYSSNFVFGLFPIQTDNKVSTMSLNIGWLSQYSKGVCYSISLGPGVKLVKPPETSFKANFTFNVEASIGYSF